MLFKRLCSIQFPGQFSFIKEGMNLSMTDTMKILGRLAPFRFWDEVVGIHLGLRDYSFTNRAHNGFDLFNGANLSRDHFFTNLAEHIFLLERITQCFHSTTANCFKVSRETVLSALMCVLSNLICGAQLAARASAQRLMHRHH